MTPPTCADQLDLLLACCSSGKTGTQATFSPILACCLYNYRKWLKSCSLFSFLACCFNWLFWHLTSQLVLQFSWAPDIYILVKKDPRYDWKYKNNAQLFSSILKKGLVELTRYSEIQSRNGGLNGETEPTKKSHNPSNCKWLH